MEQTHDLKQSYNSSSVLDCKDGALILWPALIALENRNVKATFV